MMTLRDAIRELAPLGISLRKQDGEFQVKPRADSWESPSVYFTDDIDDAYNTGRQMRAETAGLVKAAREAQDELCAAGCALSEYGRVYDDKDALTDGGKAHRAGDALAAKLAPPFASARTS